MSTGQKVADASHGMVWERRHVVPQASPALRQALDLARQNGHLLEWHHGGETLVTRRRWSEGSPLLGIFQTSGEAERRDAALKVFVALARALDSMELIGLGHGAVHPGNVLLEGGIKLVDAVSNRARLGRALTPGAQAWLWSDATPEGVALADWDRACLLRMSTVLSLAPERWVRTEPLQCLDACRTWARSTGESLTPGSTTAPLIERAVTSAELVARALVEVRQEPARYTPEPSARSPEEIVYAALDAGIAAAGTGRMLPTHVEEHALTNAVAQGVPAERFRALVTIWVSERRAAQEAELRGKATRALNAGKRDAWVSAVAMKNATTVYAQAGVAPDAAESLVDALLRSLELRDEREREREWAARLDVFVQQHCKGKTYSKKQLAEMATLITSFGVSRDQAEASARRFCDRHGLTEKSGWFS